MNNYTAVCNLARDPESITLGGKEGIKLRLGDSTFGKKAETRFFDAIVTGQSAEVAKQLKTGDEVVVSGTLKLTSYVPKQGKNKGRKQQADEMPFAQILRVTKSATFGKGAAADEGDAGDDPAPEDAAEDTGAENPLADLMA